VESSKKAVTERGWGPLTYNWLYNEELTREKDNSVIKSAYLLAQLHGKENVDLSMLNFDAGISKTVVKKIVENQIRNTALNQAHAEHAEAIHAQRMEVFNTW
jgi:hypothetical protein